MQMQGQGWTKAIRCCPLGGLTQFPLGQASCKSGHSWGWSWKASQIREVCFGQPATLPEQVWQWHILRIFWGVSWVRSRIVIPWHHPLTPSTSLCPHYQVQGLSKLRSCQFDMQCLLLFWRPSFCRQRAGVEDLSQAIVWSQSPNPWKDCICCTVSFRLNACRTIEKLSGSSLESLIQTSLHWPTWALILVAEGFQQSKWHSQQLYVW